MTYTQLTCVLRSLFPSSSVQLHRDPTGSSKYLPQWTPVSRALLAHWEQLLSDGVSLMAGRGRGSPFPCHGSR